LGSALTLLSPLPPLLSLFLPFLCCCHNRHLPAAPPPLCRPSCSLSLPPPLAFPLPPSFSPSSLVLSSPLLFLFPTSFFSFSSSSMLLSRALCLHSVHGDAHGRAPLPVIATRSVVSSTGAESPG
jgi:hypothetical protein